MCAYTRLRKRRGRKPCSEQNASKPILGTESTRPPIRPNSSTDQPRAANGGGNNSCNSFPEVSTPEDSATGYDGSINQGSDQSLPSYIHQTPSVRASFAEIVQNVYPSENPQASNLINQIGHNNNNISLLHSRQLHFPRINESNDCSPFENYSNSQAQNGRLFPDTSLVGSLPPLTGTHGTNNSCPHSHLAPNEILQPSVNLRSGVPENPLPRFPPVFGEFPRVYSHLAPNVDPDCKFPVLRPLLPYIKSIICTKDACDLLNLYITEPSTSLFECASPYVLTQVFRKGSFLRSVEPRATSPSLLAAMLWTTAQTSDAKIFKTDTFARPRICDQLYKVCITLLSTADHSKEAWKPSRFLN